VTDPVLHIVDEAPLHEMSEHDECLFPLPLKIAPGFTWEYKHRLLE